MHGHGHVYGHGSTRAEGAGSRRSTLSRSRIPAASLSKRQKLDLVDPVSRQAAGSDEHEVIDHGADRQSLVHGNHAGHELAASNALKRMPSHSRHVVREKNPTFLCCPGENANKRALSPSGGNRASTCACTSAAALDRSVR